MPKEKEKEESEPDNNADKEEEKEAEDYAVLQICAVKETRNSKMYQVIYQLTQTAEDVELRSEKWNLLKLFIKINH